MPLPTLPGPEHKSWRGMIRYAKETILVTEAAVSEELNLTAAQRKKIHIALAVWLVVMISSIRLYGLSNIGTLLFSVTVFVLAISFSSAYLLLRRHVNEDWPGRISLMATGILAIIFDLIAISLPIIALLVLIIVKIFDIIIKLMH
ncbi:MAG: hypothetical protein ORN98_07190 [Alphaproteobacteria bacterium]|nr:hypothetical protein [Alphaproteobacteria bacterium]